MDAISEEPSLEDFAMMMEQPNAIRNVAVVGGFGHGKTTLVDSLTSHFEPKRKKRTRHLRGEGDRTVDLKPYSMIYTNYYRSESPEDSRGRGPRDDRLLITMIDTPGHTDLSPQVAAALRITDGAIVVVDCISGVGMASEQFLREAMMEKVMAVMVINKMDKALLQYSLDQEELFQMLNKIVDSMNVLMATYEYDDGQKPSPLDPSTGNVLFGSLSDNWAFSIRDFADIYSSLFQASTDKIMDKLWGDDFFNRATKKWTKVKRASSERGFNMFVLDPIFKIFAAVLNFQKPEIAKLLKTLQIQLSEKDLKKDGPELLQVVMSTWLPSAKALFGLLTFHLPSPAVAQRRRAKYLYEAPADDVAFDGIFHCDDDSPMMMFVSKMLPSLADGKTFALGRVFSGRLVPGQTARYMGSKYNQSKKGSNFVQNTGQPFIFTGDAVFAVDSVPAGNICALVDVDDYITKFGTVSNFQEARAMKNLQFRVCPIIQVTVEPADPSQLRQLVKGLKRLYKTDLLVDHFVEDTGQHVIGVSGELHLALTLQDLEESFAKIPIKFGDPDISIRETVTKPSSVIGVAKSPDQHTRICMTAEPIPDSLLTDAEDTKLLKEALGSSVKKLWAFGHRRSEQNVLIDKTNGVTLLPEIKDFVVEAFQRRVEEGVLCDEPLRGVQFTLCDVTLHGDKSSRVEGQIIPTATKALDSAFLAASPAIQVPFYLCELYCPSDHLRTVFDILSGRSGSIREKSQVTGTSLYVIRVYMPVLESLGLQKELKKKTNGNLVVCQCLFDHWEPIKELDKEQSRAHEIVMSIRKRKAIPGPFPSALDPYS